MMIDDNLWWLMLIDDCWRLLTIYVMVTHRQTDRQKEKGQIKLVVKIWFLSSKSNTWDLVYDTKLSIFPIARTQKFPAPTEMSKKDVHCVDESFLK